MISLGIVELKISLSEAKATLLPNDLQAFLMDGRALMEVELSMEISREAQFKADLIQDIAP